jgi:catechol 2,3-dioxygenase-like lactoylglutathione lyase family enzyme
MMVGIKGRFGRQRRKVMRTRLWSIAAALLLCVSVTVAQTVGRPRITGLSHIALYTRDVDESRTFYRALLGYDEPFSLNKPDGSLDLTFIKVNDRQWIELFADREPGKDRLHQIAFETDDAEALRAYLASRGIKVPAKVPKGRTGNLNFTVNDPDGHIVEFVQYLPDSWTMRDKGKHMSERPLSVRLKHVGFAVDSLSRSMAFYRDILGCQETWRGSSDGKQLSWVNLTVPDGADYVELMLYDSPPSLTRLGTMNHLSLETTDIVETAARLESSPARSKYDRTLVVKTGINRKRQLNLFDPDSTRVEFMEPGTIDGLPTPSSTAKPPRQ